MISRKKAAELLRPRKKFANQGVIITQCLLFHYPQLCKVEHDLFFSVVLKFDRCDGTMSRPFDADHFAETKFLMFYFLSWLQSRGITGGEVGCRVMFDRLHVWLGRNVGRFGLFFCRRGTIFLFCIGSRVSAEAGAMHAIVC